MSETWRVGLALAAFAFLPRPALPEQENLDPMNQWAQWRGPLGTGVAPRGDPPLVWSEEKSVRWKTEIPGKGHSTPIVWGDRIFLTTAVPTGEQGEPASPHAPGAHDNLSSVSRQRFVVLAVERRDGSILWQREVRSERPPEGGHVTGSWASASPVTDGEHLYAHFGSGGLYALDLDGKLIWEKDFGDMRTKHGHGEGSSPALYGDTLIVNWDHQGESSVVAIDKHTGRDRWRVARHELTSWSTPLIVEHEGRPQAIVSATNRVRGYDLADGDVLWECGGLSGNVVASPVAADGLVYVANSYDTRAMLAIRLASAKGDVTGTNAVAWTLDRHTPYVPSPLLYDDTLCFLKHYQGFLSCLEARTGEFLFGPERLQGIRNVYASPVGAAERIYIVDRNGATAVVRRGAPFELLAVNQLDDSFSASPAVVGDELLLRGERYLYSLAEDDP
jgi:outer membrane protein assembly factor BamB